MQSEGDQVKVKFFIQSFSDGRQPGGRGGWIHKGHEWRGTLDHEPEEGWDRYLYDKFGDRHFLVTTQAGRGRMMTVFNGRPALEQEGEVA